MKKALEEKLNQSTNSQPPRVKIQLELKHVFWATALIAAGLGVHDDGTHVISAVIIAAWAAVLVWDKTLLWVLLGLFLLFLLFVPVSQVREAARRTICRNKIRQIQLAICNYESAFGAFPCDTETKNASGEMIRTSWRVHILPFIEDQNVYDRYRFDEPWNSKHNLALQKGFDRVFCCPGHSDGKTPYKAVVGPGTAFDSQRKTGLADCTDGHNTISLVEDIHNPVDFFEPSDLTVDEAVSLFNKSSKANSAHFSEDFFTRTYIGFNYATVDAGCHQWPVNPARPIDEDAFLIDGEKHFDLEVDGEAITEYHWGRIVSLTFYVLLIGYPWLWYRAR